MTSGRAGRPATRSVTAMSHSGRTVLGGSRQISRLARTSLLALLTSCALSACVVAEPPTYKNSDRTPPFINLRETLPLVTRITLMHSKEETKFNASVRSEDQGTSLMGILFLDYSFAGQRELNFGEIPGSTFDDLRRILLVPWTPTESDKGCHQVTMLVTHKDNVSFPEGRVVTESSEDLAIVTWWVNVNPNDTDPENLGVCPNGEAPP
jgi:hypothetical protein